MEDYEKKYKDALAIVKSYYGQAHAKEAIKALESAFPELKADKSKRVKEDIKYILANTDLSKVSSSFSDMLELIDNTDNQEDKAELLDGEDYGIDGLYHAIRILEKTLGEVEGYQSDDGILEHKIAIDSVKELYSKKPKWSSEDADNLEEITMFCDLLAGGEKYKLTNEQLKSISKTLKAIKKGTVTPTNQERSEDRSKELSLSLQIQAYLSTASDELYAKGKPLYSEKRIEDIHKCMLMWTKLHNAYFYQKTTWSEGDENVADIILSQLRSDNFSGVLSKSLLKVAESWLKNLKDRVQSQPKQEWSEEDENRMDNLCHFLEEYGEQYYGGLTLKGIINWVKSLRYQNAWISVDEEVHVKEPVLAQMKDKSDPFGGFRVCCDHMLTPNVYERYMILSNIVSQNAWKPSDEQIKALEIAIRCGIQLGTWEEDALKSLTEQLKKLREE